MQTQIPFRHFDIISVAVMIVFFTGLACGGPPAATVPRGNSTRSTFEADRPYDDPPLTESELSGNSRQPPRRPSSEVTEAPSVAASTRMVRGYRVQVHSFKDKKTAEAAAAQLRRKFGNLTARIHIDHDPPNYKVRVGDFRSKAEASRLLKQLQSRREYRDAWIVEAMVNPE